MKFAIALACLLAAVAADQTAEEWRSGYWGHSNWPSYYHGYYPHASSSAYIAPTRWGGWGNWRHRRSADVETSDMSTEESGLHGHWGSYYPYSWRHGSSTSGGWNHGGLCRGSSCRHARSVDDQQTSETRYPSYWGYHPYGWWGPSYSRYRWGAYPYSSYETKTPTSYSVRHY